MAFNLSSLLTGGKLVGIVVVIAIIGLFVWSWHAQDVQLKTDGIQITELQSALKASQKQNELLQANVKRLTSISNGYQQLIQLNNQSFENTIEGFDKIDLSRTIVSSPTEDEQAINQHFNSLMDCLSLSTGSTNVKKCNFDSSSSRSR